MARKATGIEYKVNGDAKTAHAAKDVVLSAGPIGSPHILQLSGIGDTQALEKAGVEVQHHSTWCWSKLTRSS